MKDFLSRLWTGVSIGFVLLVSAGYIASALTTGNVVPTISAANLPTLFAVGKRLECQVSDRPYRALEYEILKIDKESNWIEVNRIAKPASAEGSLSGQTVTEVIWLNPNHITWCKEIKPAGTK